jgi:hypothetical protein
LNSGLTLLPERPVAAAANVDVVLCSFLGFLLEYVEDINCLVKFSIEYHQASCGEFAG